MSIQKEQIIQAAITLLDRDGLEGVTLRRLAKELDIKAASIYWHIANKEELLDEMANAILQEHFGTFDFKNDKRDWAEWLDILAHELRAAMVAHREGARVVAGAHPDIALTLLKLWDFTVRVLHHNGFSYGQAMVITVTVINFTFGSVIEEQASPPLTHMIVLNEQLSFGEEFQATTAAIEAVRGEDNDTLFNTSVRIIINGVRAELESRSINTD
ncbi:MAG: TetR/AcrR family transcriptional regulator C-terminal domain-containing protein [Anaerolineae bacterium]|nr:TetR/AcrR family transcriptional regulator C-terminal domain-containing protein [Anaerolineae bacterium]MCB0177088.1 TetR/AcrR family transcriptional regulator C-terminal domain-containing protein [Anaerolineae bacterium]MCB0224339.1 TetR/AcrR family transcriptional regulator C-terminal domain-containing protein [Anaerolineae bacterium]